MEKLPLAPKQPPSSSLNPSPSSLPPRPPPSQIRPIISILPALPMTHHQKQQRKFPAQGIGRGGGLQGHASLPPKPGIPGKPLPRDTGPIVLTGGKDNVGSGSFSYSHVAKRTYSSAAMTKVESPPAARREPVMTALAPASQARVATSPVHHHKQPVATTITPPAEMMTRPINEQPPLKGYGSDSGDGGTRLEDQNSSQQARVDSQAQTSNDFATSKTHTEPERPNLVRPEVISQQLNFLSFPHSNPYENIQENSFHPNRNFNHINGHETSMHRGQLSDGYSPYILPPPLHLHHPHSHPHHIHLQHHQGFIHRGPHDPYPFPNSITPPNTGTMFAPPPPFQPHGVFNSSSQTSERGGSTNPQTPFTPTHPFPVHLDLQHQHPHVSVFSPPPPDNMVHFNNSHHEQHPQGDQGFKNVGVPQDHKPKQLSVIESNPLLRNISFFPSDSDQQRNDIVPGSITLPTELSNSDLKIDRHDYHSNGNQKEQPGGFEYQMSLPHGPGFRMSDSGAAAAHRLQSYSLAYYLSDRLSDVRLSVSRVGGMFDWDFEEFSAHSFILGRSAKLACLIEDQVKSSEEKRIKSSRDFGMTWADEMENGRKGDDPLPITSPLQKTTVLLETSDKYISRDSFLLSLRWLYGGADWELDAYLDPSHPKHRTLEWTRARIEKSDDFNIKPAPSLINPPGKDGDHQGTNRSAKQTSLENIIQDARSEEVRMLDRSIALLATGDLLGIDEVIEKGVWGIRRWGMRLEGGAIERLLEFALDASGDFSKKSTNDVDEPRARYGMFKKNILEEAVAFLVKNLPHPFKFDSRAPTSNYLLRLPGTSSSSSAGASTPIVPVILDLSGPAKLRQAYSTVLLSVPFALLKTILEHDGFATRNNDWKGIARYDIAKAVVHERERRRKHGFKVERERRASTCSDVNEVRATNEHSSDPGALLVHPDRGEGPECEDLHWEESVLCTFGHGGSGLEITRRRKGGSAGGRVLWKVGDPTVKT